MLLRSSLSSLSILTTSVLNSAFSRVLVSTVFFQFFSWNDVLFFHLGHVSLSPHYGILPVIVSKY